MRCRRVRSRWSSTLRGQQVIASAKTQRGRRAVCTSSSYSDERAARDDLRTALGYKKKKELLVMAKSRCQILADEVYQQAFDLLDAEPGVTGYEAGRAATQTKKAFERSCKIMRP